MSNDPIFPEAIDARIRDLAAEIAGDLIARHAADVDVHGLPTHAARSAHRFAFDALPPIRSDDFSGPDGPLNTWVVHHRRLAVSGGYAVSPAPGNSLVYGIQAPVRATVQRITAGIRFTGAGQIRLTLREGSSDAVILMIESSGLVIRYRADFSEVQRFSLYQYLPRLGAEMFVDFSVHGGLVDFNVDGVHIHEFETSGSTGDSIAVDVMNRGELNRVAVYGVAP